MKIDFPHPANEKILQYLSGRGKFGRPRGKREEDPDDVDLYNLGTHPDVVERLWKELTILLPEPCQWVVYGWPVLAHPQTGIIFGWAGGSYDYSLRLPEKIRGDAIGAGAKTTTRYSDGEVLDVMEIGPEWILGAWLGAEPQWCLKSYEFVQ